MKDTTNRDAIRAWKERGIALDPGTIESPGIYELTLVLGERDPATEIAKVKSALEEAGFRRLARKDDERLGLLPTMMAIPGTTSTVQKRGDEIVVAYARCAGLPVAGTLPCRLVLVLLTTELLGRWADCGLAQCGNVKSASDDVVVFETNVDPDDTFEAVNRALVAAGARIVASEAECRNRFVEDIREQARRAGCDPDTIDMSKILQTAPREVHLEDTDDSKLAVTTNPSGIWVTRRFE